MTMTSWRWWWWWWRWRWRWQPRIWHGVDDVTLTLMTIAVTVHDDDHDDDIDKTISIYNVITISTHSLKQYVHVPRMSTKFSTPRMQTQHKPPIAVTALSMWTQPVYMAVVVTDYNRIRWRRCIETDVRASYKSLCNNCHAEPPALSLSSSVPLPGLIQQHKVRKT